MPGLVVLESMWNRKGRLLEDEPSVLPYLKAIRQSLAWEGIRVNLVYRRFYSSYDLGLLLEEARRKRNFQVCYIASHGQRRKLVGIGNRVIRLETLVDHCRPSPNLGYIFGACDFVDPDTASNFLQATGARFVAGYQKPIPWTESMLVDCLFLSYLLGGTMKWIRTKHGERIPPLREMEDFEITRSENPQKVAGQLYRDFPLAHDITFSLFTLDRKRGRAPEVVNSFDAYRRRVDRARRLVRDIQAASVAVGEPSVKSAIKWIDEQLRDRPGADRVTLLDEAARRFDLSPLEEDFLLRHFAGSPP